MSQPDSSRDRRTSFFGLQAILSPDDKIQGVKILKPDLFLHQNLDILGPEMTVKSVDVIGSAFHVQAHCSKEVIDELHNFVCPSHQDYDPMKMACFHALFFIKHYLPETQWQMDDNQAAWDQSVLELVHELQYGSY